MKHWPLRTTATFLLGAIFLWFAPIAAKAFEPVVAPPPPAMKLPAFYKKYVDADGYPVVSSEKVDDHALKEAAWWIRMMLDKRPELKKALVDGGSRMIVMAHNEFTTDIPEHSGLTPKNHWDRRARGLGGSEDDPVCSCAEENLLAFDGDPYPTECIMIHEFAHSIHLRGMLRIDKTFDPRLKAAFDAAIAKGLWKNTYAATNHHEYWAEGVQDWFNNNRENDNVHNHVNTRKELREYDPVLAALCEEVFGDAAPSYTKPATRLHGHLADYDPAKAPKFVWPERLEQKN